MIGRWTLRNYFTSGRIVESPRTSDERLLVATYIATMMMRVPKQRAKAEKIVPSAMKSTLDEARATIREWANGGDADHALIARRLAEVDRLEGQWAQAPPVNVVNRIRSPWPTVKIVALVNAMTWRIIRATPDQTFGRSQSAVPDSVPHLDEKW